MNHFSRPALYLLFGVLVFTSCDKQIESNTGWPDSYEKYERRMKVDGINYHLYDFVADKSFLYGRSDCEYISFTRIDGIWHFSYRHSPTSAWFSNRRGSKKWHLFFEVLINEDFPQSGFKYPITVRPPKVVFDEDALALSVQEGYDDYLPIVNSLCYSSIEKAGAVEDIYECIEGWIMMKGNFHSNETNNDWALEQVSFNLVFECHHTGSIIHVSNGVIQTKGISLKDVYV